MCPTVSLFNTERGSTVGSVALSLDSVNFAPLDCDCEDTRTKILSSTNDSIASDYRFM